LWHLPTYLSTLQEPFPFSTLGYMEKRLDVLGSMGSVGSSHCHWSWFGLYGWSRGQGVQLLPGVRQVREGAPIHAHGLCSDYLMERTSSSPSRLALGSRGNRTIREIFVDLSMAWVGDRFKGLPEDGLVYLRYVYASPFTTPSTLMFSQPCAEKPSENIASF
jgi:hypothetical protein